MLDGVKSIKTDNTSTMVKTNIDYYNRYVTNGTWKPIGEVKYHGNHAGIVTVEAKGKRKDEIVDTIVIVHGYYPWSSR